MRLQIWSEIGGLIAGVLLRLWALSHGGRCTRLRRAKTPKLITTGSYSYLRHPIYVGNLLIGLGMIFLSEAFLLTLLLFAFIALHHRVIIGAEEQFLKEKLGKGFDRYCELVPKYIPLALPRRGFSFGTHFPLRELATACGIVLASLIVEWLESPVNRDWVINVAGLVADVFFSHHSTRHLQTTFLRISNSLVGLATQSALNALQTRFRLSEQVRRSCVTHSCCKVSGIRFEEDPL